MTDYPERINISPVFRQKREDDFYLVDRTAFPGKGTEYVRADLHAELEAEVAEAKEALGRLRTTAAVLQQNALGCAANHYGEDFTIHGTPGWLLDTQVDIDRATTTLAKLEKPSPAP